MLTISLEEAKEKVKESGERLKGEIESVLEDSTQELPPTEEPGRAVTLADQQGTGWLTAMDWQNDPVPIKWDKIRAVFLNAYSPEEVFYQAQNLKFRDWLDYATKLMNRQVELPPMQITTIKVELPGGQVAQVAHSMSVVEVPRLVGTGAEPLD